MKSFYIQDRKIAIHALVGSRNYNVQSKDSDSDYKYFVFPTLNDLYDGKYFTYSKTSETKDFTIHDIRKLPVFLYKSNINFLEVLFSNELYMTDYLWENLFPISNDIAKMNIPYLFNSCMGTYTNEIKNIKKGTEKTKILVEQYGYDLKCACHAYRVLNFLERFKSTEFKDFGKALWYIDGETDRRIIMNIKAGKYTFSEVSEVLQDKYIELNKYIDSYYAIPVDKPMESRLKSIVKNAVIINLKSTELTVK